jgi:hypothetical protein
MKPDVRMERELERLRETGKKISEEIHDFVTEREKYKWRLWNEGDPRVLALLKKHF